MKFKLFLLLPLLAVVGLLAPARGSSSAARTGSVVGIVTYQGVAVPNAVVRIEILSGSVQSFSETRTDAGGRFAVRNLLPGRGQLWAGHRRGGRAHLSFDLMPGEVERMHVQLR